MWRRCSRFAAILALPMLAAACTQWTPVLDEDFSSRNALAAWRLDGVADLTIEREGESSFLRITTKPYEGKKNGQSTLWHRKPVRGNALRFVFRARGDEMNRSIFFFNAQPTRIDDLTIFDCPREDAQYNQYAGSDRIELYTLGCLRYDQKICNLRYLGGENVSHAHNLRYEQPVDGRPAYPGKFGEFFADVSVFGTYPSVFAEKKQGEWFDCDLRIQNHRITFLVDGIKVLDVTDVGHAKLREYPWMPLTNGGWFGFRNFRTNTVDIDHLRIYEAR